MASQLDFRFAFAFRRVSAMLVGFFQLFTVNPAFCVGPNPVAVLVLLLLACPLGDFHSGNNPAVNPLLVSFPHWIEVAGCTTTLNCTFVFHSTCDVRSYVARHWKPSRADWEWANLTALCPPAFAGCNHYDLD